MHDEEIEITFADETQEPAEEIEGIVGQILINEHASPTGTFIYNEEGH